VAAPCPLERYPDLRTTLTSIRFSGVADAALPPEIQDLLAPVAADLPSGSQSLQVICGIRDRATAALRSEGYVASVQIPPQRLEDGQLRLEVITARIVEVRVRGDVGPYADTLGSRIEQLKALVPLREQDAERVLLLTDEIPGLNVRLSLAPAGRVPGEVIGDLTVEYTQFSILSNIQNYGSRQLGRETAFVRGEFYGLTGAADLTYIGASTTFDLQEQRVLQIGHLAGVGASGMTAGVSFLYAWSRPDLGALDLRSESLIGRFEVAAPIQRSLQQNLSAGGGLEIIEQRTRVFTGETGVPLNRDKLRVAFVRGDLCRRNLLLTFGDACSYGARLELRKGLDIFDATEKAKVTGGGFTPSRFEGDAEAFVVRAGVNGVVGVGSRFSLSGLAQGQWADKPLLNFEEFSIGNLTIGRGYDPGANSADRAIALRGEVRARVLTSTAPNRFGLEAFAFYDSVWIWNLDPNAIENDRRLGSWGGGLRTMLPGRIFAEMMYARPEHKALLVPNARTAPDRLLVSLTFQFSPGR
jgi:hemolysin activation/secretion protein